MVGGVLVFVLLPPSPNCPLMSHPQHFRSVLSRIAHVCAPPVPIATAVRPVPRSIAVVEGALMSVGLDTVHIGPPSPNCPPTSLPQHFKSPLSRMAQVCWVPEDTRQPFGPCQGQLRCLRVRQCCWVGRGPCRPTIAHLSILVPSPTLHVTVVKDGAGVAFSSRELVVGINNCGARTTCLHHR